MCLEIEFDEEKWEFQEFWTHVREKSLLKSISAVIM